MRPVVPVPSLVVAIAVSAGCAGNPEPGEPGYPHNVDGMYEARFEVEDQVYAGEVEMTTGRDGTVEGAYLTVSPATVVGELSGQLVGDRLSLSGPYVVDEAGCDGRWDGSGVVADGGDRIAGDFTTTGACGEVNGTFVFER